MALKFAHFGPLERPCSMDLETPAFYFSYVKFHLNSFSRFISKSIALPTTVHYALTESSKLKALIIFDVNNYY